MAGDRSQNGRKKAPPTPLTRERIVTAALALVDREGPDALSMRHLGAELGVDPMAVYYHLPGKDALLDAIVEAVMSDMAVDDDRQAPAEERVLRAAVAYRDALLAHERALPIVLTRSPVTPAALRPAEVFLAILSDAGLSGRRALAGMNAMAAVVRGLVGMAVECGQAPPTAQQLAALAAEYPEDEFPHLREAQVCAEDFLGADFEYGIRALAHGLLQQDVGDSGR
jgi:TetR/AcrR family transcriptional regulator, tetracycline repressor protein